MNSIEKRIALLAESPCTIEIINQIEINDATMYIADYEVGIMSVIVYDDGTLFHMRDWQSGYPSSAKEIEDFEWVTEDGRDAIILNGQPRIFC